MSRSLHTLVLVGLCALGGGLAHLAHRAVDARRFEHQARASSRVMPDPAMVRVASLGQATLVGDTLWIRSALTFSDLVDHPDDTGAQWLLAMLRSVVALDPGWRTVYFYGGSMMRVLGDIDGSDELFGAGARDLPDDPYFPFSLGMNAYLYREDAVAAAEYLDRAAALPGAPPWYAAAAAGFLDEHGQRRAALEYLERQIAEEEEEEVRQSLERKYRSVLHDELAARIEERRAQVAREAGIDPAVGPLPPLSVLGTLPEEPLGGTWIVAPDGHVRSDRAEARLARQLRSKERAMLISGF